MEFKMSEKSKNAWQNMMDEMEIESQMSEEALIKKKIKEFAEKIKEETKHLEHLENYHFKDPKELIDYVYAGNELIGENSFMGNDIIKLMENGMIGHYSFWLDEYDAPLGYFWKTQSKTDFEKWIYSISTEEHLDNGYIPAWHKDIKEN